MKKSKTASAGKSRSAAKKPPARAAVETSRNALRDLAPGQSAGAAACALRGEDEVGEEATSWLVSVGGF